MHRIFTLQLSRINEIFATSFDMDNFIFTATGPMFEEDIDQFTLEIPSDN